MFRVEYYILVFLVLNTIGNEAARILGVFPLPSISHQFVFRPLMIELAKRGHEVVVLTPIPAFPNGGAPSNFTEIDLYDVSQIWDERILDSKNMYENKHDCVKQVEFAYNVVTELQERQLKSEVVQKILSDKTRGFDLMFLDIIAKQSLILSHIYKIPVIQFSSFMGITNDFELAGAPVHPTLYPMAYRRKINNLSLLEKFWELHDHYRFSNVFTEYHKREHDAAKRIFGPDIPSFDELARNIHMWFLNVHPIWDSNRPVPPSVIYTGGLHVKPAMELSKEFQTYLDSSKHGVIYVSFGTNVKPSQLPREHIRIMVNVFSRLPYDVLWKWDGERMPDLPENIKFVQWVQQSDLLRHPKVLLFITQCGLQSTDESIAAGVPLLGIPMLGDQWFNADHYVRLQIGKRLDIESATEDDLEDAINVLITDKSYRKNVAQLRAFLKDQPQSSLERAVWWTEHVLRHRGAHHLRGPAANISWAEYFEIEIVLCILLGLTIATYNVYEFVVVETNICIRANVYVALVVLAILSERTNNVTSCTPPVQRRAHSLIVNEQCGRPQPTPHFEVLVGFTNKLRAPQQGLIAAPPSFCLCART
ncbi:UDP-glucosyltransferase 2-like [Aphomia sociella]